MLSILENRQALTSLLNTAEKVAFVWVLKGCGRFALSSPEGVVGRLICSSRDVTLGSAE